MAQSKVVETFEGYHFATTQFLRHEDGRKIVTGDTHSITKSSFKGCCARGLHASETPFQAYSFVEGPYVSKVILSGKLDHQSDKSAGTERKYVKTVKLTELQERELSRIEARADSWNSGYGTRDRAIKKFNTKVIEFIKLNKALYK